jgi:hypothetical protein
MLVLETALPAKFAATIREALGATPSARPALQGIEALPKRFTVMPVDVAARSSATSRPLRLSAHGRPRPLLSLDEALAKPAGRRRPHPITADRVGVHLRRARAVCWPRRAQRARRAAEDNTSMDGYALHAADVPPSARAAGGAAHPGRRRRPALAAGTAARIFTGAQVPAGADAVVMQEQCEPIAGEGLGSVRVNAVPTAGQWIRRRGEDVRTAPPCCSPARA